MKNEDFKLSKDAMEDIADKIVEEMYGDAEKEYDQMVVNVVKAIQKGKIINNLENQERNANDYSRKFDNSKNNLGSLALLVKILLIFAATMVILGIILSEFN